jgi:hypothetical protein
LSNLSVMRTGAFVSTRERGAFLSHKGHAYAYGL